MIYYLPLPGFGGHSGLVQYPGLQGGGCQERGQELFVTSCNLVSLKSTDFVCEYRIHTYILFATELYLNLD